MLELLQQIFERDSKCQSRQRKVERLDCRMTIESTSQLFQLKLLRFETMEIVDAIVAHQLSIG